MAKMEREMASLHKDFKQIEETYGDGVCIWSLHPAIFRSSFPTKKSNDI